MLRMTELRDGDATDLPLVNAIMQRAFDPRYGEAWTASQCSGMLALPGMWLTIASVKGIAAGFALSRLIIDEAELLLLATLPATRGQGVGTALLRSVISEAEARGAIALHLEVRSDNPAITLYSREGFRKTGERRGYYRGPRGQLFDAHSYRLDILK